MLASRGVRMLTSAEIKAYTDLGNSVVAAAQSGAPTNWEVTLPETVIDAVMDDIRRAHPLLDEITFMNTHGAIKMLVNKKGAQTAVWGKITSAIAAELEGAFDAVDTMLLKLSAYMPMEIEFETVRIGQCDVVVDEQPQYNPVSGMIPFMDMEPYTEFLQFIAKRPITLAYKPKNAWYFTSKERRISRWRPNSGRVRI